MLILTFEYLQWDFLQVELVRKKKRIKKNSSEGKGFV